MAVRKQQQQQLTALVLSSPLVCASGRTARPSTGADHARKQLQHSPESICSSVMHYNRL